MLGLLFGVARPALATSHSDAVTFSPASVSVTIPGAPPELAWPPSGEAAAAVAGVGLIAASSPEPSRPIASLTKMMTALIILRDHPLTPGESGPEIAVTPADVADYEAGIAAGDSVVKVSSGEVLSEFQLLEGLLVPSGDNLADLLADWDAGSVAAFVAKMNAEAAVLGLPATHYADASGVSPGSTSTAAAQALVAARLMASAVVREIVRRPSVVLPVAGRLANYNPALGVDGIVGVKSGWTSEAGSCLVTAAFESVGGHGVLVISVALGQGSHLTDAAAVDERLLDAATHTLFAYRIITPNEPLGTLQDATASLGVPLRAPPHGRTVVVWPGLTVHWVLEGPGQLAEPAVVGTVVGTLRIVAPWGQLTSAPVSLNVAVPGPGSGTAGAAPPPGLTPTARTG